MDHLAQMEKLSALYETWHFYCARTTLHWSLLSATQVQFTAFFKIHFNIMLPYKVGVIRGLFPSELRMRLRTKLSSLPCVLHTHTIPQWHSCWWIQIVHSVPPDSFTMAYHFPFLHCRSESSSLYAISVLLAVMACTVYSTVSLGNLINSKATRQTNAPLEWSLKPHSLDSCRYRHCIDHTPTFVRGFLFLPPPLPYVLTLWIISNRDQPKLCKKQQMSISVAQNTVF